MYKPKFSFLLILSFLFLYNSLISAQTKNLLSNLYNEEILKEKLLGVDVFTPVPKYCDKYWVDSIPLKMRMSYIKEAEKYLDTKWESLNIIYFSDFRENGDRERCQNFIFSKRNKLMILAMGEIMECKGRFINDILNGMFSVCEETWWGVSAHYGPKIPLPNRQTLALFSAETGGMMSWLYYMFKEPIRKFSPLLEKRILSEVSRRVLEEGAGTKEWWRNASMNWNPWICSNWLACVLLTEYDLNKQINYLRLIFESLDLFIDKYPYDGGCDEGAHYWDRAACSLYDCLILLHKATGGYVNLFCSEKIRLMGDYISKMNIGNGYFVNFADAGPRLSPHVTWYSYGLYLDNRVIQSMSTCTAIEKGFFDNPAAIYTEDYLCSFSRELTLLSNLNRIISFQGENNILLFDSWLPRIQVMTARSVRNSTDGLFIAAKGGHNAESHNHNDVGHFIIYADGHPLFIDPGVGTYRKETFNDATRYKIWSMQSGFHNLPIINGVDQKNGRSFGARNVKTKIGKRNVVFSLDIAGAYPSEAKVQKWIRTIDFIRNKNITIIEDYELKENVGNNYIIFMSCTKPEISDGIVKYKIGNKFYALCFDKNKISASYEEIKFDDFKFIQMWGEMYRLRLRINDGNLKGKVMFVINEIK